MLCPAPATTEIYTLSLHDALPIYADEPVAGWRHRDRRGQWECPRPGGQRQSGEQHQLHDGDDRSEEHTSELQSRLHLVCRLLLEKKKPHCEPATDRRMRCCLD